MTTRPIGVIVSGADPVRSLQQVKDLGLECCQMSVPDRTHLQGQGLQALREAVQNTGVPIVGCFCHFRGESYADIPTIRRTVGLVNADTQAERLAIVLQNSDDIAALDVPTLLAHIGFIPEDGGPDYEAAVKAVRQICQRCAKNGQSFGLETGQETAPALKQFIADVGEPNLKVNFDPANMLLYGSGKPLEALELLKEYLVSVHCKDGCWPKAQNQLGEEVPFGEGEVNVPIFMERLKEYGFAGPLVIEREISGDRQRQDIIRARDLILSLR